MSLSMSAFSDTLILRRGDQPTACLEGAATARNPEYQHPYQTTSFDLLGVKQIVLGDKVPSGSSQNHLPEQRTADDSHLPNTPPLGTIRTIQQGPQVQFQALASNFAAHKSALKPRAQACLDFHKEVRKAEQEAYQAALEATHSHVEKLCWRGAGRVR